MSQEGRNRNFVAITLRITEDLLAELDEAAHLLQMTRTALMRQSLFRNLAFFREVERPECVRRLQASAGTAAGTPAGAAGGNTAGNAAGMLGSPTLSPPHG